MSSSSQAAESWIAAFCSLVGHEYFAEVSEDFIEDDFNLTGLQSQVPMYKEALEMILDVEPEDASDEEEEEEEEEDEDEDEDEMHDGIDVGGAYRRPVEGRRHYRMPSDQSVIESSAEMLYGLIHQRFITSRPGIQQMAEKYEMNHFGHCPRVFCHGAKVLPVGCSDIPGQETVKLFCPSCLDVYSPPNSRFQTVDGAFFGTTFGCLFFMTFPDLDVGGQQRPAIATASSSQSANASTTSSPLSTPLDRPSNSRIPQQQPPNGSSSSASAAIQPRSHPDQINGIASRNLAPGLGAHSLYEPRIYGFRVNEAARTGPRMKWLRSRPENVAELDECAFWAEQQAQQQQIAGGTGVVGGEQGKGDVVMGAVAGEVVVEEARRRPLRKVLDDVDMEEEVGVVDVGRRKAKEREVGDGGVGGALINGDGGGMAVRVGEEG